MALELAKYENNIKEIAYHIKNVFHLDVIVVDRWLYTLVNTFRYHTQPIDVRMNSIVGSVIVSGKPSVIRSRKDNDVCRNCEDFETCELDSVIGVPMMEDGECVGVIAALVRDSEIAMLEAADDIIALLTAFSELLIKAARADTNDEKLQLLDEKTFSLVQKLPEPVVGLDADGHIRHANAAFMAFFAPDREDIFGDKLVDLLAPNRVQHGARLEVGDIFTGEGTALAELTRVVHNQLPVEKLEQIVFFRFRESDTFINHTKAYRAEEKMEVFFGTSERMQRAKKRAAAAVKNNLPVLIEGVVVEQNRELMKIISRYDTEDNLAPVIIECAIDAEELKHMLFGNRQDRPGFLWPVRNTAVCFAQIDRMPLYIQEMLEACLMEQLERSDIKNKVRIYATTTRNLHQMHQHGRFRQGLLQLLSQNHITIPDIRESNEDLKYYFSRYLYEFSSIYKRERVGISTGFMEELLRRRDRMDWLSIRETASFFAETAQALELTASDWQKWDSAFSDNDNMITEKPDALVTLRSMLDAGYGKTHIAKKMGISRATLYRWMKDLPASEHSA